MKNITIIIVDDHSLFIEGVKLLLNQFNFIKIVHQALNGQEYLKLLEKVSPDIVLMDINMPVMDGVETTIRSKKLYPDIKIIALSMHDNIDYYTRMTDAGVDGFVTKDTNANELKLAINKVLNGEGYFSKKVLENVIQSLNKTQSDKTLKQVVFSKRELEILLEMARGLSNVEIAEQLFISHRTVERHKENMYKKTLCKNGICLVVYAIKNKLVQL